MRLEHVYIQCTYVQKTQVTELYQPVLQSMPIQPAVQTHVYGDTQLPLL